MRYMYRGASARWSDVSSSTPRCLTFMSCACGCACCRGKQIGEIEEHLFTTVRGNIVQHSHSLDKFNRRLLFSLSHSRRSRWNTHTTRVELLLTGWGETKFLMMLGMKWKSCWNPSHCTFSLVLLAQWKHRDSWQGLCGFVRRCCKEMGSIRWCERTVQCVRFHQRCHQSKQSRGTKVAGQGGKSCVCLCWLARPAALIQSGGWWSP